MALVVEGLKTQVASQRLLLLRQNKWRLEKEQHGIE